MAASLPLFSLLIYVSLVGNGKPQNEAIVEVTRNRTGDVYRERSGDGPCEIKNCTWQTPTLGPDGTCHNDFSLRNQYCPSNESQFFLSTSTNSFEIFAIIGNNGILKVFNNRSGNFETGRIINNNLLTNSIEPQSAGGGCNITSVENIQSLQHIRRINSHGFSVQANSSVVAIQFVEVNLTSSRENYNGRIFRLNISCPSNEYLDCIVIKLNGTSNYSQESTCPKMSLSTPNTLPSFSGQSTITTESTTRITSFWEDPVIQNIMIGSGCGIGVLICIIAILCAGICTLSVKSKNSAELAARRMELRYNTTQDEDHYFINRSLTSITPNNEASPAAANSTENNVATGLNEEQPEEHTYASVDDAQAELEDIRQKETRAKKFGYASITFDTFKPSAPPRPLPPAYQPELDEENRSDRLPSFARNYNPAANRVQLARSYEVVTLMHKPSTEATNTPFTNAVNVVPKDEYDILSHPERKPTMSQRNFSISQAEYATDYSQLDQVQKQPQQMMTLLDEATNATNQFQSKKPIPKARRKLPNPMPLSSYTSVKKNPPPPLPPPYDPRFDQLGTEEEHYKVPKKLKRAVSGHYDQPSSLLRVAWSCEDFGRSLPLAQALAQQPGPSSIYDMPSSMSPPMARKTEEKVPELSLHSLISQDSYVDMLSTQV